MKRIAIAVIVAAVALVLLPATVFAIGQPTTIEVKATYCYQSVLQTGDMLCVVHYEVTYTTPPTDYSIDDAYLLRMFTSTSVEVNSDTPYYDPTIAITATTSPPINGYGENVSSFYYSAIDVISKGVPWLGAGYSVTVQGNPSVFTGVIPSNTRVTVQYADLDGTARDIGNDVITLAGDLQKSWKSNEVDLLQVVDSQTILSANGERYFSNAIPNLRLMKGADIFGTNIDLPVIRERVNNTTTATGYEGYFNGSTVDTGLDAGASILNMPSMLFRTILSFGIVGLVIFLLFKMEVHPAIGFVAGVSSLTILAYIGLVPLALIMLLGFVFVLIIGWKFFYREASV